MSYSAQYAEHSSSGNRRPAAPRRPFDVVPDAAAPCPPKRRNRKALLRGLFHTIVLGTGALLLVGPSGLHQWSTALGDWGRPLIASWFTEASRRGHREPLGETAPTRPEAARPPPTEALPIVAQGAPIEPVAEPPIVIATVAPVIMVQAQKPATGDANGPAAPDSRLRNRAVRAGLHPGLSRAVLARLTDADFANARHAIRTALATTPDGRTFSWPVSPARTRARFMVHFVEGAAATCRRYVVTIVKARWETTALPMETCGITAPTERPADATRHAKHDARSRSRKPPSP